MKQMDVKCFVSECDGGVVVVVVVVLAIYNSLVLKAQSNHSL